MRIVSGCKSAEEQRLSKYECGFRQTAMLSPADSTLTLNRKLVMKHNEVVASGLQFTRLEDSCCAALISFYVFIISSCRNFPFYAVLTRTLHRQLFECFNGSVITFYAASLCFYGVLMGPILILMRV